MSYIFKTVTNYLTKKWNLLISSFIGYTEKQLSEMFYKKVCKILRKILVKIPSDSNVIKKRPWHRCFPVNFVKFLGTPSPEHIRVANSAQTTASSFGCDIFLVVRSRSFGSSGFYSWINVSLLIFNNHKQLAGLVPELINSSILKLFIKCKQCFSFRICVIVCFDVLNVIVKNVK